MRTYSIRIIASTEGDPTDLELSDVCLHLANCLDAPQMENIQGGYDNADFTFESWAIEMYEETGERVWLYTRNASDPRDSQGDDTGLRKRSLFRKRRKPSD